MPTYIKLHINKKNTSGRNSRGQHCKPLWTDKNFRSRYGNYSTTGNFFVTSFKTAAVGHSKWQNNGPDNNSSDARYNSYTKIRVKFNCQKCASTVLERFFKTFNKFHTFLKCKFILNTHHISILLPYRKKERAKVHLCNS